MDWSALWVSLRLGAWTVLLLLPVSILLGRHLAFREFRGKRLVEALVMLPLVLPPTVFGFYLLSGLGGGSVVGRWWESTFGGTLVFNFHGLVIASVLVNVPFAVQPAQRGFEAVSREVREAAACCGMSSLRTLWRVELPLAWPGVATAMVLSFAHTLGEFGVVLMVGGSIPEETRTLSIAIYDRVQAFDEAGAAVMSSMLVAISVVTITLTLWLSSRIGRRLG